MSRSPAFITIALLCAAPALASAQTTGAAPPTAHAAGHTLRERAEALRQRIHSALDTGLIDSTEAAQALKDLHGVRNDEDALQARNGDRLPEADRAVLEARLDRIGREIHWLTAKTGASPPPASMWSLQRREHWVDQRVSRGLAEGLIDGGQAARVREELTDIRYQDQRLRAAQGGRLVGRDLARLQDRLDRLVQEIRWSKETGERRPW